MPKYLANYKREREEARAKEEKAREEEQCPPGTRRIAEEERLETLAMLSSSKAEVESMLLKLPISMRTKALQSRKTELENKLTELEKAIGTFSAKVVYIAL